MERRVWTGLTEDLEAEQGYKEAITILHQSAKAEAHRKPV